jgi:hypothetical protein
VLAYVGREDGAYFWQNFERKVRRGLDLSRRFDGGIEEICVSCL